MQYGMPSRRSINPSSSSILLDKTKYFLMQKGCKIQPQIEYTFSIVGMERTDEKLSSGNSNFYDQHMHS